ncbi:MAG: GTPase [Bacilli bacterium]
MIKKCIGCGIGLQDINKKLYGYTPSIDNDYCERCFKITNYNEKIDTGAVKDNYSLINKVNKKGSFVIFLIDYLNIYDEVINLYKSINNKKVLVITKSDIIPKNIVKKKLISNIKKVYNIDENIIYVSAKSGENLGSINRLIEKEGETFILGFTNTGKSSLINKLTNSKITVSKNANTTLDFIKVESEFGTIIDAPGFIGRSFLDSLTPKNIIKPLVYQLESKYYLHFLDIDISSNVDNNLTIYLNNEIKISKRREMKACTTKIKILKNTDLIIKGLGFINIKKECILSINGDAQVFEKRASIVGGNNESY